MRSEDKMKFALHSMVLPLSCPLCSKPFEEATTIDECMHTFCKRCIIEKLSEKGQNKCPICSTELEVKPSKRLRKEQYIDDLTLMVFPKKPLNNDKEPADVVEPSTFTRPSFQKGTKSKTQKKNLNPKRFLPEDPGKIVQNSRQISTREPQQDFSENFMTEKNKETNMLVAVSSLLEAGSRVISRQEKAAGKRIINYEEDNNCQRMLLCHQTSSNLPPIRIDEGASKRSISQNNSRATEAGANLASLNPMEYLRNRGSSWLNSFDTSRRPSLFNRGRNSSKVNESNLQQTRAKLAPLVPDVNVSILDKLNNSLDTTYEQAPIDRDETEDNRAPLALNYASTSSGADTRQKQAAMSEGEGHNTSAPAATDVYKNGRPVWFSLVPAPSTKGVKSFPKISPPYFFVKNGDMPVSFVGTYVAQKLNLPYQSEVQITMMGHSLNPSASMQQVEELWYRSTSDSERNKGNAGDSAEGSLMVLCYARRAQRNA
ncbi:hypothetical protein ACFE04_015304 [Oxalis oulophora]